MTTKRYATVNVSPATYERLKARGKYGQSMSDIIQELLDLYDKANPLPAPTEPQKPPDRGYEAPTPEIIQEAYNEHTNNSNGQ